MIRKGHVESGPMTTFYETYTSLLMISVSLLTISTFFFAFCKRQIYAKSERMIKQQCQSIRWFTVMNHFGVHKLLINENQ